MIFSISDAEPPVLNSTEESAAVRTIKFEDGGGAILGKPEFSDYYKFLETLRGPTGDETNL